MNIEELELSLRTEFEGQMRNVVAGIRKDVAEFQRNLEAEFQKHRDQMDAAMNSLSGRFPETFTFDPSFKESLTEHLRLARDEGAQIAANAFDEAEKLRVETAPKPRYDQVRDAISDITSKSTQSTILSTLVEHVAHFAPRGAFFIVKNDHFVGWKAFGSGVEVDERSVRDIHFPLESHSTLSEAVGALSTVQSHYGAHGDDLKFLEPLGFGQPGQMFAVPLSARGRGVAVLYADKANGGELNIEAIETLVRVAGLTVELLAASQAARPQPEAVESKYQPEPETPAAAEEAQAEETAQAEVSYTEPEYTEPAYSEASFSEPAYQEAAEEEAQQAEPVEEAAEPVEESVPEVEAPQSFESEQFEAVPATEYAEPVQEYSGEVSFESEAPAEAVYDPSAVPMVEEPVAAVEPEIEYAFVDEPEAPQVVEEPAVVEEYVIEGNGDNGFAFSSNEEYDAAAPAEPEEEPAPLVEFAPVETVAVTNGNAYAETIPLVAEPVVEVAAAEPVRNRFRDRNVDLPIEVAEEERRVHNDARRFARLLVSEIKLYNEQKVAEGRDQQDLYDRLREAIDRSREMYDKRVQPAVASKFDYFHYELVSGLAEGDAHKLGGSYPGAAV